MRKSLLGLRAATISFFCGTFIVGVFYAQQNHISNPLFEKAAADIPLYEAVPFNKDEKLESTPDVEDIDSNDDSENQFFYGWYSLNNYKNMPEVNMILLGRDYEMGNDYARTKKIAPSSGVFTSFEKYGDQGFVDDAWTKMEDNNVSFKTNKIKGIEYRFKGVFFKNKTMGKEGEKILRGTLQKFVKGKKIAEVNGDFEYYEPHCWH